MAIFYDDINLTLPTLLVGEFGEEFNKFGFVRVGSGELAAKRTDSVFRLYILAGSDQQESFHDELDSMIDVEQQRNYQGVIAPASALSVLTGRDFSVFPISCHEPRIPLCNRFARATYVFTGYAWQPATAHKRDPPSFFEKIHKFVTS